MYVEKAMRNAETLGCRVEGLKGREGVARCLGTGGEGGEEGYVNWGSGCTYIRSSCFLFGIMSSPETSLGGSVLPSGVSGLVYTPSGKQD